MAGTYTARLIVDRPSVAMFQRLLDIVMALSGLALLWAAMRQQATDSCRGSRYTAG